MPKLAASGLPSRLPKRSQLRGGTVHVFGRTRARVRVLSSAAPVSALLVQQALVVGGAGHTYTHSRQAAGREQEQQGTIRLSEGEGGGSGVLVVVVVSAQAGGGQWCV